MRYLVLMLEVVEVIFSINAGGCGGDSGDC